MGQLRRVDADPPVAFQRPLRAARRLGARLEHVERQPALLRGLFLQRGGRDLAAAVRREPSAAAFEQTVGQARRVEEGTVDVRLGGVKEYNQVESIIDIPENTPDAVAHENPLCANVVRVLRIRSWEAVIDDSTGLRRERPRTRVRVKIPKPT